MSIITTAEPIHHTRPEDWHNTAEDDLIRDLITAAIAMDVHGGIGSDRVRECARKIREMREPAR